VIKPPRQGSTVGVQIVKKLDEIDGALAKAAEYDEELLVEKFVPGRELTIGILGDLALPILEIIPKGGFYDFKNKYPFLNPSAGGSAEHICPAPIPDQLARRIRDLALRAHRSIGLKVYSRVDVMLPERGEPSVLELNTIPGMTEVSLLPDAARAAGLGVPVSGIAGDQQAALFGQACVEPGMTKNTYGTGSFVLTNLGPKLPEPVDGLLTTIAWSLAPGEVTYAMEGAIFVTGAAVQWLRDGLGIIEQASDTEPLALSVADTGGVFVVPAFTGLGSPWWDPYARGTIVGITRGTTRAHIARAVVEAMALQTADVVDAVVRASGVTPTEMRIDGGASVMNLLCQLQADLLDIPVRRAAIQETTALGAAFLAGVAEGVWDSPAAVNAKWTADASFTPAMAPDERARRLADWRRAVERSRDWARDEER
jgi:glycerol kinase